MGRRLSRILNGDTLREANTDEVNQIKNENVELKNLVAELMLGMMR
jgi:hypothetical protein